MKPLYWIILIISAFAVFAVKNTPAILLTQQIEAQTKGDVEFLGVSGTIFSGQSNRVISQGISVDNVKWQLSFLHLLLGKANIEINGGNRRSPDSTYINGDVTLNLMDTQQIEVRDFVASMPAKSAFARVKLPIAITANGKVTINIDELVSTPVCESFQGNGVWPNASVDARGNTYEIGNFDARFVCMEGNYGFNIQPNNLLNLSASASFSPSGSYAINARFKPDESLPTEIKQAAALFPQRDSEGFHRFSASSK